MGQEENRIGWLIEWKRQPEKLGTSIKDLSVRDFLENRQKKLSVLVDEVWSVDLFPV